jgi:hypothetical protein
LARRRLFDNRKAMDGACGVKPLLGAERRTCESNDEKSSVSKETRLTAFAKGQVRQASQSK